MRIYDSAYDLMSEMGRDLWEMGIEVCPKTYQNKIIEGNDDFKTKEIICEQYCLTKLPDPDVLFVYTKSKEWAEEEFKERITPFGINPGEAWKLRKDIWEQFLNDRGAFDYTYGERLNQGSEYKGKTYCLIDSVIKLLADDPGTRKAVLPIFGGSCGQDINRLDGTYRIPCSMYYNFLIRKGKLNICYHQRSSDFIQHFGNDVWLAWKLMLYVVERLNSYKLGDEDVIEPGYLYHTIDSLHVYKKDWVKIKSSIDKYL